MSFDISVSSFHNGENHPFPRQILEDAFAPYVVDRERSVTEPEGPYVVMSLLCPDEPPGVPPFTLGTDDLPEVTGFAVNRPPGTPLFWLAILKVLRQTPSVLYWPGMGCCVADAAVIEQLPKEWIRPDLPMENQPGIPEVLPADDRAAIAMIEDLLENG